MAIIAKQTYTPEKIDKLRDYLKLYAEKNMPIDYEILVDGFKAVRRTADVELFSMFENFVGADTKNIEILFYTGTSNNNDKHLFTLAEETKEQQGLSGIEIDHRIQEGIDKEKRSWEFDAMKAEIKSLKEEVSDLEEEIEKLETERENIISKQSPLHGLLGEVGSSVIESFVKRNPKILASIPGGHALAGLIEGDQAEGEPGEDAEVSFKSKNSLPHEPEPNTYLSEEAQQAHTFVKQLKSSFTKQEFDQVLEILQHFAENKETILQTLNILKPDA